MDELSEFVVHHLNHMYLAAFDKARVEHPFGHIKMNLKTDGFLLRGQTGVNAEISLLATCFNLARMITILGVSGLIERLMAFKVPGLT